MNINRPSVLETDEKALEAASYDFGRTVRRRPKAIARPGVVGEVVDIIRESNRQGTPATIQGAGHSQNGQSLSEDGILVDMKGLNKIGDIEDSEIRVQGGVRWRDLVERVCAAGYLPPALTTHLTVTVGGTLSVGGLSISSHLYGSQVDNVTELEVVTGDGRLLRCSVDANSALFDSVRCGLGQFGVITEARIRLRKALPKVRTYGLLYEDVDSLMQDFEMLAREQRFQHIDGWCLPIIRDAWQAVSGELYAYRIFPVYLSVEWGDSPPNQDELLGGLHYSRLIGCSDNSTLEFVTRMEKGSTFNDPSAPDHSKPPSGGRAEVRRGNWFGDWNQSHPCTEGLLPWSTFPSFFEDVVSRLPAPVARKSRIMLGPFRGERLNAPLLMRPEGDMLMGYGILIEAPPSEMGEILPILADESRRIIDAGGKRYLSGWLDFDSRGWREHFGERWAHMLEWKREFDPRHILNPDAVPLVV